jgi:isoquinoline 1-oxidoreductase beta subunit
VVTVSISRRHFVLGAGSAPALVIGFSLPPSLADAAGVATPINAWLRISSDDTITIMLSQAEMGQDIYTTTAMLVAEELEADWEKVRVEFIASTDPAYANPRYGAQMTAGSSSTIMLDRWLRSAGAEARERLRRAAAARWRAPLDDCRADRGAVVSRLTGARLSYGRLAIDAAGIPAPADIPLKAPQDWRILGKPTRRLDAAAKVRGRAVFGIDVEVPGMLIGTVRACPVFGGRLAGLDTAPALGVRGVHSVVRLEEAFVVLADGYWAAKTGADLLRPVWEPGPLSDFSSETLTAELRATMGMHGAQAFSKGARRAPETGAVELEASYETPYLAHATLEPMNGTVHVRSDGVDAWLPTQSPAWHRTALAGWLGLRPDQVNIRPTFLGGGFGRRAELDFVYYPAMASKACGRPVKVIWSREEDMQHDVYRPAAVGRLRAELDPAGLPRSVELKLGLQSVVDRLGKKALAVGAGAEGPVLDPVAVASLAAMPYGLDFWRCEYVKQERGAPVGTWRGVSNTYCGFFLESFIDEIAHAGGRDPVDLRRQLLAGNPRALTVLNTAAACADWGHAPAGRSQGVALFAEKGTVVCQVVEASVDVGRRLTVHRIVCVVDCGRALNPGGVEAQMQGAALDALGAALSGEITLKDGRVVQSNFDAYRMLRMRQAPPVEVRIVESGAPLGGIGEPAMAPLAAALTNAIFAATGDRVRSLPVSRHGYQVG